MQIDTDKTNSINSLITEIKQTVRIFSAYEITFDENRILLNLNYSIDN